MPGGGSLGGSNLHGRDCAAGFRSWMMGGFELGGGIFGKGGQTSKSWDVGPPPASQPASQAGPKRFLPVANCQLGFSTSQSRSSPIISSGSRVMGTVFPASRFHSCRPLNADCSCPLLLFYHGPVPLACLQLATRNSTFRDLSSLPSPERLGLVFSCVQGRFIGVGLNGYPTAAGTKGVLPCVYRRIETIDVRCLYRLAGRLKQWRIIGR